MYKFKNPLLKGLILSRPNRFIFEVKIGKEISKCHCPTTGKIADVVFKNIPCLLSKSENVARKTPYSVEAIFINNSWVGINQNMVNRFVEHFLITNQLSKMITFKGNICREKQIGASKIDFMVENNLLEVKTPLQFFSFKNSEYKTINKNLPSTARFLKHLQDLGNNLNGHRAILTTCFLYDAQSFIPPQTNKTNEVKKQVIIAIKKGVEMWQINMKIDENGVRLLDYFEITDTLISR